MSQKQLFVGIDVCEEKLDVFFMDQDDKALTSIHSYPNLPEGFKLLRQDTLAFSRLLGKNVPITIGFESTGNYHKNLEDFLKRRKSKRFTVRTLNPYQVKEFRKAHFKLSSTDRINAKVIAKFLKVFPSSSFYPSSEQLKLRFLTRFRRTLIEERTRYINRLRKNLRLLYPGYKKLVGGKIPLSFLKFLSSYTSLEDVKKNPPKESFKRRYISLFFLSQVREKHSFLQQEIRWVTKRIIELQEQIGVLEEEIEKFMDTFYPDHVLLSIPGIGKITCATILAEVGDSVDRFPTPKDFVGYIGLYPVVFQSGKNRIFFKMTWKGNKYLKMAFLLATASARCNNPHLRNFYNRLRARGKSKKAAGGALARKLALLVYAILSSGKRWDEGIASESINKGNKEAFQNFPILREEAGRLSFDKTLIGAQGRKGKSRSTCQE